MKNILIVEDDRTSNFLYQIYLKDSYNIFYVYDTIDIYDVIRLNKIDLILLDIKILPENGFMVAKKIKIEMPEIKIIAQTAHMQHFVKEKDKNIFDLFLEKPLLPNILLQSIDSLLN